MQTGTARLSYKTINLHVVSILQLQRWLLIKKSRKIENSEIFLSSRGITVAKINRSHRNTRWNCKSLVHVQNKKSSFNAIAAKMAKNVQKTVR
jgi:hypothetical protein